MVEVPDRKRQRRMAAKRFHPDAGGSESDFIAAIEQIDRSSRATVTTIKIIHKRRARKRLVSMIHMLTGRKRPARVLR